MTASDDLKAYAAILAILAGLAISVGHAACAPLTDARCKELGYREGGVTWNFTRYCLRRNGLG